MKIVFVALALGTLCSAAVSQSGGTFDLSHNVIAGGGESHSTGGSFVVDGTVAQPLAGSLSGGGNFDLRGGFWAYQGLEPTAAPVSIGGRVTLDAPSGMARVRITLVDLRAGATRVALPNQFGYYRFDNVEVGTYILQAAGGGYRFSPSELVVNLLDNLTDSDFSGIAP